MNTGLSAQARTGTRAGIALLGAVAAGQIMAGPRTQIVGLLASAPFLAAAFAGWRAVVLVGSAGSVLAAVLTGLAWAPRGAEAQRTLPMLLNIGGVVLAAGGGVVVGALRQRQMTRLAELAQLVSVAQTAVLRPCPPQVGPLAVASLYLPAGAGAEGADLYEALDTPYGARVLVGAARGRGLDAVWLASAVLGSFRHVAYERADPRMIVADLDRAVTRWTRGDASVSAVLIEVRGGTLSVACCGAAGALLLRRGAARALGPAIPAPPLGYTPIIQVQVERLEPGDRLVCFTAGLGEARRNGQPFPTAQHAQRLLATGNVAEGLAALDRTLHAWTAGRLDHDVTLMVIEQVAADRPARC